MTVLLVLASMPLLLALKAQVALFVAALFVLRIASLRFPTLAVGTWLLAALTIIGGLNVLDAYHGLAGKQPGTALLLTMVALKLLEVRRCRDLRVLTTVFGFVLIVAFLFDTSPWIAGYLGALLLGNIALMADLGAMGAQERLRTALRTAGTLTVQALPLAVVLFLFFPRLDAPLWNLGLDGDEARTGLKNWLEPGSVTELVVSGEDAFRVRFDKPLPIGADAMYWRGPVLWRTDGRRWTPLEGYRWPRDPPPSLVARDDPVHYTVVMEPTGQRWLMALEMPVSVPDRTRLSTDFQLTATEPVNDLRVYRVSSVLDYRIDGLGPSERTAALQLPDNITPRMRRLVADWGAGATSAEVVVERALAHFNEQPFRYTLLPPPLGENAADAFLFETQSGFCEHYASAFVLLMRLADIPARIVAGYLGGEYNPISDDYLVRQSDAHAWSEVWIDGRGWMRVDPTAAVAAERVERDGRVATMGGAAPIRFRLDAEHGIGRLLHGLRLLADAADAGWTNWVIGFSSIKQQRMLDGVGLGHLRQYGLAALMGAAGLAIMLGWSLALARRQPASDPVVRAWEQFSRVMARIGLARRPREGPADYRDRIIAARPDLAPEITAIVNQYARLRYGAQAEAHGVVLFSQRVRGFRPKRRAGDAGAKAAADH
jgi:transglutaminase-like putative cysteine protease